MLLSEEFKFQNPNKIKQGDWSDFQFCLSAVKQNPLSIQFVKNKTEEICLEAVKRNGLCLWSIKRQDQTQEICLEAVKQNGRALRYVKNQTKEICLEAIKQNMFAVRYVKINILPFEDWDTEWFSYLDNVELRRAFIKERGKEVLGQLNCIVVDENEEYCLVQFKYKGDQIGFQKALVFRCPSSNDVYFQEVRPNTKTIKTAVKFLNNNIRKEELAFES